MSKALRGRVSALLLSVLSAQAFTLRVPEDYATIQNALDATQLMDTVLVAPGSYNEFLVSPQHSFVMTGWYASDTLPELRTVLDPIPEAIADTPSVFHVVADTAFISNLAFFNRRELRQEDGIDRSGGIENGTNWLQIQNCRFDSVSAPVRGGHAVTLTSCVFQGCFGICVQPDQGGPTIARNCYFEAAGYTLVWVNSNSRFQNCIFACNTLGAILMVIQGSNVVVDSCRFGPCVGGFWPVEISPITNILNQNCIFENLDEFYSVIAVGAICDRVFGTPVVIRGNTFRDNHNRSLSSGILAITMQCANQSHGYLGVIENNTFTNGTSNILTPGVHSLYSSIDLRNNSFSDLGPQTLPDIYAEGTAEDSMVAYGNFLLPPGLAASRTNSYFDARENWWGDSTGPHNSIENPDGQGSDVGNGVLFSPWLTHPPDTTIDTTHISVDDPSLLLPFAYGFAVCPNPFNSTVTFGYSLTREQHVTLQVFDLLGREVATLANKHQFAGVHSVNWSADSFASGLYFARLTSPESRDNALTAKLLLMK